MYQIDFTEMDISLVGNPPTHRCLSPVYCSLVVDTYTSQIVALNITSNDGQDGNASAASPRSKWPRWPSEGLRARKEAPALPQAMRNTITELPEVNDPSLGSIGPS